MLKKVPIPYKVISILLKLIIISGTTWYIFSRLKTQDYIDFRIMLQELRSSNSKLILLGTAILLMLINWGLETKKWQLLTTKLERLSFWKASQAVLCGVTFAVFTPNRIGEFGGRIFQLEPGHRIKGALASVTGSMAQFVITLVAGSVGFILYLHFEKDMAEVLTWPMFTALSLLILGLSASVIIFYLNSRLFIKLLWRTWLFRKIKRYLAVFNGYTQKFLSVILLLSLTRYVVFTTQFIILLYCFDVDLAWYRASYLIALMYLIAALIPTYALSEVTTRGSVTVMLFESVLARPLHISGAYFLLWLINLAIPALIGSLFVLNIHFFKNREKLS